MKDKKTDQSTNNLQSLPNHGFGFIPGSTPRDFACFLQYCTVLYHLSRVKPGSNGVVSDKKVFICTTITGDRLAFALLAASCAILRRSR